MLTLWRKQIGARASLHALTNLNGEMSRGLNFGTWNSSPSQNCMVFYCLGEWIPVHSELNDSLIINDWLVEPFLCLLNFGGKEFDNWAVGLLRGSHCVLKTPLEDWQCDKDSVPEQSWKWLSVPVMHAKYERKKKYCCGCLCSIETFKCNKN